MKLDIPYFWGQIGRIFPGLIIPVFLGTIMTKFTIECNIMIYLLLIAVYGVAYSVSCWLFSMNQYEKGLLLSVLKKLKR